MKVLVIEDEPKVAGFIKMGLEEQAWEVEIAYDGVVGLSLALQKNFEIIVLDINLPLMNGFEVCRQIRAVNPSVPILMLTALGATDDKILGFDNGADDYLVKPFEFKELVARIKALHKRSLDSTRHTVILKLADLEVNTDEKTVRRNGIKIDLTAKEFLLLAYMLRNKGKVISRSDIAVKVWDISFDTGTNVIDVYINFLRKKIDRDFSPKLIHTVIGMGYIMKDETA
jgi:DNA-binding response OmpR family regulator